MTLNDLERRKASSYASFSGVRCIEANGNRLVLSGSAA